jgi:hypothetical protein
MKTLCKTQLNAVLGGNKPWAENDDLIPTVVRGAGIGAIGGAIGGPATALAGAVIGGIVAFGNHESKGGAGHGHFRNQCQVDAKEN